MRFGSLGSCPMLIVILVFDSSDEFTFRICRPILSTSLSVSLYRLVVSSSTSPSR